MHYMYRTQPMLRLPLTDMFGSLHNHQSHPKCKDFELRVVDCMEAYGWHIGLTKCQALLNDLNECLTNVKQARRFKYMRRERKRQIKAGEREDYYVQSPPTGVF